MRHEKNATEKLVECCRRAQEVAAARIVAAWSGSDIWLDLYRQASEALISAEVERRLKDTKQ